MVSLLVTGSCGLIGPNFVRLPMKDRGLIGASAYDRVLNLDALSYAENLAEFLKNVKHGFVHRNTTDHYLVSWLSAEKLVRTVVAFTSESYVNRAIQGTEVFIETNVLGTHLKARMLKILFK
jgi:dTDP-glucose 4,6-dehydratase